MYENLQISRKNITWMNHIHALCSELLSHFQYCVLSFLFFKESFSFLFFFPKKIHWLIDWSIVTHPVLIRVLHERWESRPPWVLPLHGQRPQAPWAGCLFYVHGCVLGGCVLSLPLHLHSFIVKVTIKCDFYLDQKFHPNPTPSRSQESLIK